MKSVDRYTKTVLTVIAVCLFWIAFGGHIVTPAYAQRIPDGTIDVNIAGIGGWPMLQRSALPVEVESIRDVR